MHPSTEDLLTLRDGDAADAEKLASLRAAPGTAHAVARLERMRDALRALPDLDPPADAWEAIEARFAAPPTERVVARGAVAARAVGLAAALVLAVIAVLSVTSTSTSRHGSAPDLHATSRDAGGGSEVLGDTLRRVQERFEQTAELPIAGGGVADSYATLERESQALEQMLGTISFQRAAMSGATASAIVGLEDRIALIDAYLVSDTVPTEARAPLMSMRVDLLAALVSVRLAQAQPLPF